MSKSIGGSEKTDLVVALQSAGREVGRAWQRACGTLIDRAAATAESHKLIAEPLPGGGFRAWVQPRIEPNARRYPCVEMRPTDDGMQILIVEGVA